jgi:tetratricopeptide (TPR) repeat protein
MKKSGIGLLLVLFSTFSAFAQSIQEGVNHLYAERYASAKTTFEKMTASNPNNAEAIYWLGQTHIGAGDIPAARAVYEKAITTNAPLALVGMGHVELLEGKTAEARQRFETAITTSRGKKGDDPNVLNAIGRANVESKTGDVAYAITKLTAASAAAPNNGDIFINLGNAYRKARDGGQAVTNYSKASQTHPALASYRTALIYQTQRNWEVFNQHLSKAVAADPKFAPAYNSLYNYQLLYKKDFAAANDLAQKYISASDPSVQNDYFKAQASFLQKNYDEAISIGKNILSQVGDKASANLYRLLTYSYLEKGDTATAKQYVDLLFSKAKEGALVAQDVTLKADVYSKDFPEQVVQIYLDAAVEDTAVSNKMAILQEGLEWARKNQRKIPEGDILLAMYNLRPSPNPASLIQVGLPFYQGGNYQRADSVFQQYSKAFPDSVFGYLWSARSLARIDTAMTSGLAMPQYEQLLRVSELDKVRMKSYGLEAVGNLAQYHVNVKSDKEKGVFYLSKGLEFDPENAAFKSNIERLQKPPQAAPKPKAATAAKKPAAKKAVPKKK